METERAEMRRLVAELNAALVRQAIDPGSIRDEAKRRKDIDAWGNRLKASGVSYRTFPNEVGLVQFEVLPTPEEAEQASVLQHEGSLETVRLMLKMRQKELVGVMAGLRSDLDLAIERSKKGEWWAINSLGVVQVAGSRIDRLCGEIAVLRQTLEELEGKS